MSKLSTAIYFCLILLQACSRSTEVNHVGNLHNIMQGSDISAKISLNDLKDFPNLYAVGALENLDGEILIYNSSPSISHFKNVLYVVEKSFDYNATLLIYSQVKNWNSVSIPSNATTLENLENFIRETSARHELTGKAFAFMVEGTISSADWHVVKGNAGGDHSKGGVNGQIKDSWVRVVGFYSEDHQGIFTHHGSNIHAHVMNEDETIVGHLDDLHLGNGMVLKLPD